MMMDDDQDDAAAQAYAAIAAQLQSFTSSKLGSVDALATPVAPEYHDSFMEYSPEEENNMDSMDWYEHELQDETKLEDMAAAAAAGPNTPTPRRTPLLERADTPVMSNSSTTKRKLSYSGSGGVGVQQTPDTPSAEHSQQQRLVVLPPILSPRANRAFWMGSPSFKKSMSTSSTPNQSFFFFRRYHDTLWNYLTTKRSLSHRLDLERQAQSLQNSAEAAAGVSPTTEHYLALVQETASFSSSLSSQERRTELDYLSQLQQLCWSTTPSPSETVLEGDAWMLLQCLRQLGLPALLWEDDATSQAQYARAQTAFVQLLASQIGQTQGQILETLASPQAPLVIQRRFTILEWIQTCLDQVRMEPKSSKIAHQHGKRFISHPDDADTRPPLGSEAAASLQNMLQASLGYILAGRLIDAQDLARSSGQSWRAAAWSGGRPFGYGLKPDPATKTITATPIGNPCRFLWKRQAWKNGRRYSKQDSVKQVEGAIYALMSNDVETCLSNPNFRTWSHALGAAWTCMWGRLEDEILHMHGNNRRRDDLTYPGNEYATQESEQLLATSQLGGITELQLFRLLWSSPFAEIRGEGFLERAMTAFLLGKSAILDYCHTEVEQVLAATQGDDQNDVQVARLRFLTHLTLFLDSLQVSTTPVTLENITTQKNQMLHQYVLYLEAHSELWPLTTLYVSLLPEESILQWYPTFLVKILDNRERQGILGRMQELFPDLVINVLERTVHLSLQSSDIQDEMKCQSLQWLLFDEQHAGHALICANVLLRSFFLDALDDKMDTAMGFVEDHLPEDLVDRALQTISNNSTAYATRVQNARSEHLSFLAYLDAYRIFGKWKDVIASTPPVSDNDAGKPENTNENFNAVELDIATQHSIRDWARRKKEQCQAVVEAAEHARLVLHSVLTHPGGWLSFDNQERDMSDMNIDGEEQARKTEIAEIQSRYLVLAINLYHQVCEETAAWLSRCWDDHKDASSLWIIQKDRKAARDTILQEQPYKPNEWYQHALDLAILISDDRHGIHPVIGANDLKEILSKLAETAVSKLMIINEGSQD